jgi:tetratricopeptide (TPR) repeat protein
MSPEQAVGQHELLGPASDVYSLGATLYSILTGRLPVDGGEVAVLLFRVRQGQIPPPRQVKPDAPAALEAVCRKAMALNPGERYPTALALAADVEAWLAGEKVSAWREPWSVRAGRQLRRHSTLYGSVAAAGLVGLISLATATALLAAANERERQRADGERQAREIASKRLEQIDKGYHLLATVFEKLDPRSEEKGGPALRVQLAEGLGKAAVELEGEAIGDARTVANLQETLGKSMHRLGRIDDAVKLLEKAVATRSAELGDDQLETVSVRADLASAYQDAGRLDLAIPLYESALKGLGRQLGTDHAKTLDCQDDLATAYEEAGQLGRAIALHERTLKARTDKRGDDHEDTYFSRNNLAVTLMKAGDFDRAIPLLERTVSHREKKLGVEHFDTLVSRSNLAAAYHRTGKLALAIPLFEGNVKPFEAQLGETHPHTLSLRNNLGCAYRDANRIDLALPLLERTLRDREAKLGNDHPATLTSRSNLAECYLVAGKPDLALGLMQPLVPQARAKLGAKHPSTALFTRRWIETLIAAGQHSRAVEAGSELVAFERTHLAADDPLLADSLTVYGYALLKADRPTDAEPPLQEAVTIASQKRADDWTTFNARALAGAALFGQKKDGESLLLAGYQGMKSREARIPAAHKARLSETAGWLAKVYEAQGKKDQADEWRKKVKEDEDATRTKGTPNEKK